PRLNTASAGCPASPDPCRSARPRRGCGRVGWRMSPLRKPATLERELTIGFVAFPGVTALDLVGPHEVLSRLRLCAIVVATSTQPLRTDHGLTLVPEITFDACPEL